MRHKNLQESSSYLSVGTFEVVLGWWVVCLFVGLDLDLLEFRWSIFLSQIVFILHECSIEPVMSFAKLLLKSRST